MPSAPRTERIPRWIDILPSLAAAVLYARSVQCDFALDDRVDLLDNRFVRGVFDPAGIFTTEAYAGWGHIASGHYRPLLTLTRAVMARVFGLSPAPFHLLNVLLFSLFVFLTLRVVQRLSDRVTGLAAAAILAVHPLASESVAAIAGLKELASSSLGLAALDVHLRAREEVWAGRQHAAARGRGGGWRFAAGAFALLCAGLLYKEAALTFLAGAVAAEFLHEKAPPVRSLLPRLAAVWPLAGSAVVWLALRALVTGGLFRPTVIYSIDNPLVLLPEGLRRVAALGLLPRYLALVVWPACLASDYSDRSFPLPGRAADPWVFAGAACLAALVAGCVVAATRRGRMIAFGLSMLTSGYLLVSHLIVPIGTLFAERLFFVPLWGAAVAAGAGAVGIARLPALRSPPARRTAAVGAGLILAAAALRTGVRIGDWKDNATLSASLARCVPDNLKRLVAEAEAAGRAGRRGEAKQLLDRAAAIRPSSSFVQAAVGHFLLEEGDAAGAERALRASAEGPEPIPGAVVTLAVLHLDAGRLEEAAATARSALAARPSYADAAAAHLVLGEIGLRRGDVPEAEAEFHDALREAPDDPAAHFNLGRIFESGGRWREALAEYQAADATSPRERLADVLAARARAEDALGLREEAARTRARLAAIAAQH